MAASVVLGLAAGSVFLLMPGSGEQTFRTARGEQRSIVLEDGSLVVLNTLSEIRIDLTSSSRRAVLTAGEALFDVAKDPDRPFTVDAGPLAIRVTGTRFNVYRQQARTVLTVVEGKVEVTPAETSRVLPGERAIAYDDERHPAAEALGQPATPTVTVTAGERVAVDVDGGMDRDVPVNLERATAWTQRRLIFDNESLARVSEEFNRYNRLPVIIEDSSCAGRRITGVFNATDTRTLVAFLERQQGITVRRDPDAIRVTGTPGDAP